MGHPHYSPEIRARIVELWLAGWKREAIAAELGIKSSGVWRHVKDMPRSKKRGIDTELLKTLIQEGLNARQISKIMRKSRIGIRAKALRLGLPLKGLNYNLGQTYVDGVPSPKP